MSWYVLFVETGRETIIQKWIQFFFEKSVCYSLVPKRKLVEKRQGKKYDIVKTIFPGYVFINTEMCIDYYYKLTSIPGLIRILNNGAYYSEIDEREIHSILRLIGNSDTIDYTKVFLANSQVSIVSGPLCGMEGIIQKIDIHHGRAKIMLEMMGTPKLVDVGIELLKTALQ